MSCKVFLSKFIYIQDIHTGKYHVRHLSYNPMLCFHNIDTLWNKKYELR